MHFYYFLISSKYNINEIKAPIIHPKDSKTDRLTFHIVDAEKINPIIKEKIALWFHPDE
tara:strand:+ start:297 stop:473 length:177 start_codon:yes stop_codon:yes gene_type:complete